MDRTRIRWRNVGRLVAGLAGAVVLIAVVPGLVNPGDPPPLPPDVGLEPDGADAYAYSATPSQSDDRQERGGRRTEPERRRGQGSHAGPARHAQEASPSRGPSAPQPPPQTVPAPSPPPASTPPAAPAPPPPPPPAPAATPPAALAPSPPPAHPDHASAEYGASPTHTQTPSAPSQFGFEH